MAAPARYVLGRRIGSGGMADVFEATAQGLGAFSRRVAVKKMRVEMLSDPAANNAFLDEAAIASALHHANIVSIVDYGMVDGVPFQVFELIDGYNVRDLRKAVLESGRAVSSELALSIGLFVAHALAYAHELRDESGDLRRIVHRDVSPQNILISWSGDVKLADFGVAAATQRSEKTATGFIKGNASYMAPEQARAEQVDARADVFALGCVLHWFLRGASPIEGVRALNAVISGADPAIDGAIDPDVAAVLADAMRASVKKRTPNMRVMLEQLGAALASRGVADPRAVVLSALRSLEDAPTPRAIEDLFRPLIIFDGEEEGLRRFKSVATPPPVLSAPRTAAGLKGDEPGRSSRPALSAPRPAEDTATDDTEPSTLELRDDAVEISAGAKLGPFVLLDKISEGGFAAVYRAQHELIGRMHAVKVLKRGVDSPNNRRRIEREARALANVRHPHILSLFEFGVTEDGLPYLVTELIEGATLRAWVLRNGVADLERIVAIGLQLAAALAHVHALGLVHRDLKPTNVIIESEAPISVKLIDFGIARLVSLATNESHLTSADQILGTPSYMPPEQIRDPSSAEPRSDLYALGCLLFFLASGRAPFEGSRQEVLEAQISAATPSLPIPGLDQVVSWLMAKEPERRPANAAEVIAALSALVRPPVARSSLPIASWVWGTIATASTIVFAFLWLREPIAQIESVESVEQPAATGPVRAQARAVAIEEVAAPEPATRVKSRTPRAQPEETRSSSPPPPAIDLDRELAARGLSRAELVHFSAINGDEPAETILATIDTNVVPKTLLSARLDEIGTRLAACASKSCDSASEVESDYLELRIAAAQPGDQRALVLRTAKLLARARRL